MNRRGFLTGLAGCGLVAGGASYLVPGHRLHAVGSAVAQTFGVAPQPPAPLSQKPFAPVSSWAGRLIAAAEQQIGTTIRYDGSYVGLSYPGGDIDRSVGVCTDVVIRAYRDAFDIDLQKLVHEDMRRAFGSYPPNWGLKRPDKNIDHRRVPNLERFFARRKAALPVTQDAKSYLPGDLVSQRLPGNLPHIAIVSHRPTRDGKRPLIIHNIGAGTRLEDRLFEFKIVGHFRFSPSA